MSNVIYGIGGYNPPYSRVYEYREYKHDKMAYRTGYIISLAYIKTMSMTEKIAEKKKRGVIDRLNEAKEKKRIKQLESIKTDNREVKTIPVKVLKAAQRNKLTLKQTGFVADIIDKKTGTEAALNNYEIESKDKYNTAHSIAVDNLQKTTIQKTITEILSDCGLDKKNIVEFHRNLRDKTNDHRIKMETNRDFLKISGVMREIGQNSPTVNIQVIGKVEKMAKNELDSTLSDLIEGEIIE